MFVVSARAFVFSLLETVTKDLPGRAHPSSSAAAAALFLRSEAISSAKKARALCRHDDRLPDDTGTFNDLLLHERHILRG